MVMGRQSLPLGTEQVVLEAQRLKLAYKSVLLQYRTVTNIHLKFIGQLRDALGQIPSNAEGGKSYVGQLQKACDEFLATAISHETSESECRTISALDET